MSGRTQLRWLAVSSQLFLTCAVLFWPGVTRAANQARLVFGQERFTRSTGVPDTQSRQFTVPAYVTAPFTLDIINGNPESGNGAIPDAVSSGSLSVDGHEVVAEREFSKTTPRITKEISLTAGAHTLDVRLDSAPDSYIRVSIAGVIALGDLTQPRSGHTATLLADNNVLIAGGMSNGTAQRTAERFDVATLKATALSAPLAAARSDHAAALLPQRDALLTGGSDAAGPIPSAELYRAASATFSAIGASLPIARSGQSATLLLDGSILILGGHGVAGSAINQSESFDPNHDPLTGALFNPINGAFKLLPHALSVARSNHTATLLPSGQILVAGGRNDAGLLSSAELFDPASGRSTPLPSSLNIGRAEHSATLRSDGSVVIAGGVGGEGLLDSIEVYAPQSQSFAPLATKLIVARRNHTATLLSIGEILIAGGEGTSGTLAHAELIGPAEADTSAPQVMATAPANGSVGADLNGIVAVRFSEPVNVSSLTAANVRLSVAGQPIAAVVSAGESGLYAFIVPNALLAAGTTHTVSLENVRDLGGSALPSTSSSFTTVSAPSIASFSPAHGPKGTSVRVVGSAFDPTGPQRNIVSLGS
ncbi:MAG TPA: kelch repeat-containing protein, partial [Thermoanaerobaculia bacterium]